MNNKDTVMFFMQKFRDKISEQEIWWLLEKVTGASKTLLLTDPLFTLTEEQIAKLILWVKLRTEENKPLQYILESVPFCGLDIYVEPPVLIPRPETEEWTTWVIQSLENKEFLTPLCRTQAVVTRNNMKFNVLDMCCGSGCIGLAIARAFPEIFVTGADVSELALSCAHKNKERNNITNITFIQSDVYQNIPDDYTCNIIIANPPYLAINEYDTLARDVREWEDYQALIAGPTGLELYARILAGAKKILRPWGDAQTWDGLQELPSLIFEIGYKQDQQIQELLHAYGYKKYELKKDSYGAWRFVVIYLA